MQKSQVVSILSNLCNQSDHNSYKNGQPILPWEHRVPESCQIRLSPLARIRSLENIRHKFLQVQTKPYNKSSLWTEDYFHLMLQDEWHNFVQAYCLSWIFWFQPKIRWHTHMVDRSDRNPDYRVACSDYMEVWRITMYQWWATPTQELTLFYSKL